MRGTMDEKDDQKSSSSKRKVSLKTFIISIIVVFLLGIIVTGGALFLFNSNQSGEVPQETGTTEQSDEEDALSIGAVAELYTVLMSQHYQNPDSNEIIQGAMDGMAEAVEDPYTEYLDSAESTSVNQDIQGSFEGIGAEIMKEGEVVRIISPIPNSPAEEAGLQPNDGILEVDGQSVADLDINEAVELIKGPEGSTVELTIQRGEEQFTVSLERASIPVESVFYEIDENNPEIGYVQITGFNMPTYDELVTALQELEEQGAEKYIFDLRGNPGGLLTSALELSNIFVEDGEPLMQTQESEEEEPVTYEADSELYGDFKFSGEAVVLINGGSASASEILSGAMQNAGYPVLGTPSYGKGTVQTIYPLESEGDIKFTNGIWLTAAGEWINEEGIQPDIEVDMPEYQDLLLINPEDTYALGDASPEVQNINSILSSLGYNVPDSEEFTEETESAVLSFQAEEGLEQTGEVSGDTAATLIVRVQELIEENDRQYEAAIDYLNENE